MFSSGSGALGVQGRFDALCTRAGGRRPGSRDTVSCMLQLSMTQHLPRQPHANESERRWLAGHADAGRRHVERPSWYTLHPHAAWQHEKYCMYRCCSHDALAINHAYRIGLQSERFTHGCSAATLPTCTSPWPCTQPCRAPAAPTIQTSSSSPSSSESRKPIPVCASTRAPALATSASGPCREPAAAPASPPGSPGICAEPFCSWPSAPCATWLDRLLARSPPLVAALSDASLMAVSVSVGVSVRLGLVFLLALWGPPPCTGGSVAATAAAAGSLLGGGKVPSGCRRNACRSSSCKGRCKHRIASTVENTETRLVHLCERAGGT